MRPAHLLVLAILLFGCFQGAEVPQEEQVSDDLEVSLIAGENYSAGEPIALQLRTSNYSISYTNRSGGYSVGSYPSVWICRQTNESCENVEYRRMLDFSKCVGDKVHIEVPSESSERREVFPAEKYDMILLWNQKEWKDVEVPCGAGFAQTRVPEQVPPGNYSATFVYWVSWSRNPRSVTAEFRIRNLQRVSDTFQQPRN